MATGYAFGDLHAGGPATAALAAGHGALADRNVRRPPRINGYGNPSAWSVQKSPLFTAFSFLACKKYPPSLDFLLMTLGPVILTLGLLDRTWGPVGQRLILLGRVPLFFYLLQWLLVHALAVGLALVTGQPSDWLFGSRPFKNPPGYGYGLPVVYGMWVVSSLLLYFACRWFADSKRRRKDVWLLRYL